MPKLPVYETRVNQQPLNTAPVQADLFTSGGRMMSDVGKQLDAIATKFYELDVHNKTVAAEVDVKTDLMEIENKYENDSDFSTIEERSRKDIEKAVAARLESIPDGQPRQQAAEAFRLNGYNTFSTVRSRARSRQIANTKALNDIAVEQAKNSYVTLPTPEERGAALVSAQLKIDESVRLGIYTPELGTAMKEALPAEFELARATFDAQYNPALYQQEKYNIGGKDKSKVDEIATKKTEAMEKQAKQAEKELQRKTVVDYGKRLYSGQDISLNEIADRMKDGSMPEEFAVAYQKAITSPKLKASELKDPEAPYLALAKQFVDAKDEQAIEKMLANTISATGTADQKALNSLIRVLVDNHDKDTNFWGQMQSAVGTFIKLGTPVGFAYQGITSLFNKLNEGLPVEQAQKEAKVETQKAFNPNRNQYEVGEVVSRGGQSFKVIGYDDFGNPQFQRQ